MAETVRWRILEEAEWPRLEEFLLEVIGPDAVAPDPGLSTVIVLVNEADEIAAAFSCSLKVVLGSVAVADGVSEDVQDLLFKTGVETFREISAQNGIVGQIALAFNDPSKLDLMHELGFVALDDKVGFVGNF